MIPRFLLFRTIRHLYRSDLTKPPHLYSMMSCLFIVTLLAVFILPLLTTYQSTLPFIDTKNSSRQEKTSQRLQPDRLRFVHEASGFSPIPSFHATFRHPQEPIITKKDIYVLVDTSQHRLFVMQEDRIVYTAIASTGKGTVLKDPQDPNRQWTFETPKGNFTIVQKLKNPVWIRPDWAFIEKGKPIPDQMSDRLMPGVLGAYALGFGDGYFIHGALYTNLLGQDVTHGCIQLHAEALQYVFDTVPLGTQLIII